MLVGAACHNVTKNMHEGFVVNRIQPFCVVSSLGLNMQPLGQPTQAESIGGPMLPFQTYLLQSGPIHIFFCSDMSF